MNSTPEPNGWTKWSMHVLEELKRLGKCVLDLFSKINKLTDRIAKLETKDAVQDKDIDSVNKKKVKQGFWGAIGGVGTVGIVEFIKFLIDKYF